jgi:hypothetical protein
MPPRRLLQLAAVALLSLGAAAVGAQQDNSASIFTCVDAQGRRLTSDRPILACIDREQRELGSTGTLRRIIPPTQTAAEREAREAREREAYLERQRSRDILRRDQALITRYPDQAAHEAGRKEALTQTQAVVDAAERRIAELAAERKSLDDEMEFYRRDPAKAPAKLRRAIEDNAQDVQEQRRAIAGQQEERNRIHARFNEEAARLRPLWAAKAADAQARPGTPPPR